MATTPRARGGGKKKAPLNSTEKPADPVASATTVSTDEKQQPEHLFKPGQSGNPNGRPKGSRNKLGEAFLADMLADWEANGVAVIAKVRVDKPDAYLKVVASILPQQLNVRVSEYDEMTDDQVEQRIHAIARALELEIGVIAASGREAAPKAGKSLN